jgi:hypothetical protein
MDERLCGCGRWITEVEPNIWALTVRMVRPTR